MWKKAATAVSAAMENSPRGLCFQPPVRARAARRIDAEAEQEPAHDGDEIQQDVIDFADPIGNEPLQPLLRGQTISPASSGRMTTAASSSGRHAR